jgi:NADH:ubiquinone oxidoreductase subunit 6 (subunit J)
VDLVLTIVFFICAILAVAGALGASLVPDASWRLLGLLAMAVGTAGVLVSFSAGFAALVALVCLGASAVLIGGATVGGVAGAARLRFEATEVGGAIRLSAQIGAVAAALLLAILLAVAVAGSFASGAHRGDGFGASAVGRVFFGRDALALEAVGAMLMAALAIGAAVRGRRT